MVLNQNELLNVYGGKASTSLGIGVLITALGSFIIGIIDGFLRPLSCNKWIKMN